MIEVKGIKKKYGKHQVLNDINFAVSSGQKIAIVGKNGCGKSTLLQIMAGVLKADGGSICYFGHDAFKEKDIFKGYCGYVPQENPLMEELSVKDNLLLWKPKDQRTKDLVIEQFELEDILKKKVKELSGGMKRRLSLACTMMQWPPILLLDEPTTALDLYYKESIDKWLDKYCQMNGIVVITSHEESEILSADKCLYMADGEIKDIGKINDISIITKELKHGKEI